MPLELESLQKAVVGAGPLDPDVLRRLREAFEESDLPFRVDLLDWHGVSDSFRRLIEKRFEVLVGTVEKGLNCPGK